MAKTYLEPEEIKAIENGAGYLRDRLLIRLLFRLGCRVSEAMGISVEDIDFKQGTVTIEHLKARTRLSCNAFRSRLVKRQNTVRLRQLVEKAVARKKRPKAASQPLDDDTLSLLKDYIKRGGQ
jgi:integrase/recombinase XerD